MRRALLVLLLLACAFSISSDVFAQPGLAAGPRISSGGDYRLSPPPVWRIGGTASGGGYSMAVEQDSGCCCKMYIPCVKR